MESGIWLTIYLTFDFISQAGNGDLLAIPSIISRKRNDFMPTGEYHRASKYILLQLFNVATPWTPITYKHLMAKV